MATATAQGPENCQIELVGADRVTQQELSGGRVHQFFAGNVRARCIGQETTMSADSAARYSEFGRMDFIGNVTFVDTTVSLTADRAFYRESDDQLEAFDNVRLVNIRTGTELMGPHLLYWRVVAGVRDTAELYANRRPTVKYKATPDESEPYVIRGQEVRLIGDTDAWAAGAVTIDRSDFVAKSDTATLDLNAGEGVLIGHAEAGGRGSQSYTLRGRKILYRLTDNELTWIQSEGMADATSSEWRMVGDTLQFDIANDLVQGGVAWGDSIRPAAMSTGYTITGDSVAIDSPDQQLTEVRSVGTAKATSRIDSLDSRSDWMAGDTVIATFAETEAGARVLSQLLAIGNAQAFYHIFDPLRWGTEAALSYSRGLRITAHFKNDAMDRIDVVGEADGIYLEPVRKPQSPYD